MTPDSWRQLLILAACFLAGLVVFGAPCLVILYLMGVFR